MDKNGLGNRLRKAREKSRLTQKYVADKIGIHNSTLGKYELGEREPDLEIIKQLAEIYDVYPVWLILGPESENNRGSARLNDLNTTIQLIEEEARKMGLHSDDPAFKEMLSNAF